MFRTTPFDRLLDKATSQQNLEPDWAAIIQITDTIRQGDVQPKDALASIKKKLTNANPHVVLYALLVLESCVKNCGSLVHDEVGTKGFMQQMIELAKSNQHEDVKNKILALIQAWAHAFRNSPKYRAVPDGMNIMKTAGFQFPALNESDAMFKADTAPEWVDGDTCHRCRTQFNMMLQRKHHCRACGQVFCHQCSSKNTTLPKFGIEKEVRVCEDCFEKFTKNPRSSAATGGSGKEELLPAEYLASSLALQSQAPPAKVAGEKTEEELKEEEELALAIALSESEAESQRARSWSAPSVQHHEAPPSRQQPVVEETGDSNPELAKYLDRSYWEQKREETREGGRSRNNSGSSAQPLSQAPPPYTPNNSYPIESQNNHTNHHISNLINNSTDDQTDSELKDFIHALKSQVEILVNRMKSNSSRGRHVANDSSVQTLFVNITRLHSRLLVYIQEKDDKRVYFEGLQDKLTQVKDARAALDALREEAAEKLRAEAEAAERAKQIAMAAKLDLMRKKKQEYLQYQRSLALQKVQEREMELQQRQRRLLHQQNSQGYYDPNIAPGPPGSQYQPGPQYHYNMMPPGPPGPEMWAPDSKPMMNPPMVPMGQQTLPGAPPMGLSQPNQPFNPQGQMGPSIPQQMGNNPPFGQNPQLGQPNPQMGQIHPMQPDMGMMQGMPNTHLSMGHSNPPAPMNPTQIPGPINPNVPINPSQINQPNQMNTNLPHSTPLPHATPQMQNSIPPVSNNPNIPHQQYQQGLQSGGQGSTTSQPPQEVKNEDNTAELISFD